VVPKDDRAVANVAEVAREVATVDEGCGGAEGELLAEEAEEVGGEGDEDLKTIFKVGIWGVVGGWVMGREAVVDGGEVEVFAGVDGEARDADAEGGGGGGW
jgi:hypothetical protein